MLGVLIVLLVPVLLGAAVFALLSLLRRRLDPEGPNWPLLVFLLLLGVAANNTSAVWFAGGDSLFSGGFLGDNGAAAFTGSLLLLAALPGAAVAASLGRGHHRRLGPVSGMVWGWLLFQSGCAVLIWCLGVSVPFASFPGRPGLPLAVYVPCMVGLHLAVSFLLARRYGGGIVPPLIGLAILCALTALLVLSMLGEASDPTWGLALTQTRGGFWYTRLELPAALLLGDYQYRWDITPPGLWLSALAPHLLFAVGWLAGLTFKPSETRRTP